MAKQIVLASSSPRRQKILTDNNISFEIIKPEVEEVVLGSAKETVLENSKRKAEQVFSYNQDKVIIASDTVVSLDDKILGKPENLEEAFKMLKMLSGKAHEVLTAVSIRSKNNKCDFYETSRVFFKALTTKEIENYFSLCNPLDKAGSYNIDEHGELIIEKIEGSYENIMGLPIGELKKKLKKINF